MGHDCTPLRDVTSLSSSTSIDSSERSGTCFAGTYADMRRDARPSQLSPSRSCCASDVRGSRNGTSVLGGVQSESSNESHRMLTECLRRGSIPNQVQKIGAAK